MFELDAGGEAAGIMLERRWFGSIIAVREQQAECDALRALVTAAHNEWRSAREELARLEALRDALGDLVADDLSLAGTHRTSDERPMPSAA